MGHGKGRGGTESGVLGGGGVPAFDVRMLDMMSQQWLSGLSASDISDMRAYFNGDKSKWDAMQSALDHAPSHGNPIEAYLPVNANTIKFVRALATHGSVGTKNMQEMHLWRSTALESSSSTKRLVRVTIEPGMRVGGVTSLGGKDLRAPKVYVKNGVYRVTGTHTSGGTTIYDVTLSARS